MYSAYSDAISKDMTIRTLDWYTYTNSPKIYWARSSIGMLHKTYSSITYQKMRNYLKSKKMEHIPSFKDLKEGKNLGD